MKFYQLMIITVVFLSLPLTAQEKTNSSQNDFINQIKTSLIPLKTLNANENIQDLTPLAEILKNKRIIGMGESTHGTQEFYQMKHRLFKFLVQKLDFTVLMLETPPQYTRPLNEYIKNGKGDIKAFYSSYIQTKETIALVEWMKNYNANVSKDKMLSIASFDLGLYEDHLEVLKTFLHSHSFKLDKQLEEAIHCINDFPTYYQRPQKTHDLHAKKISELLQHFQKLEEPNLSSSNTYQQALHYVKILHETFECVKINAMSSYENMAKSIRIRDKIMADKVLWLAEKKFPKQKIALWAHNLHLFNSKDMNFLQNINVMGSHLKKQLQDQYYIIALAFFEGNIYSSFTKNLQRKILPTKKGSLVSKLQSEKQDHFFIDFTTQHKHWSQYTVEMRNIGSDYKKSLDIYYYMPVVLGETFDGVIYTKTSTPKIK